MRLWLPCVGGLTLGGQLADDIQDVDRREGPEVRLDLGVVVCSEPHRLHSPHSNARCSLYVSGEVVADEQRRCRLYTEFSACMDKDRGAGLSTPTS